MYDVLIIGGGLVGCSLACALQPLGLHTALVEATAAPGASAASARPPSFDQRNLALAAASLNALEALGVLRHLALPPAPIRRIHVSRSGDFGAVRLSAAEHGREAFGGVVVAADLGAALEARVQSLERLDHRRPARLVGLHTHPDHCEVELEQPGPDGAIQRQVLRTRLLVAADGTDSLVRTMLGIDCEEHDYGQTLFVSSIATDRAPDGGAWERFTDDGPVALLPRPDGCYGGVMGVATADAARVAALDEGAYLHLFRERFGGRAGRMLRVGARTSYPIRRRVARTLLRGRVVLVGNAAQAIHPIGAQGFNLGLRDALTLAELLARPGAADDPGAGPLLAAYPGLRDEDRQQTLAFSHGLAQLTARSGFTMHLLRSLGLSMLERLPSAKAGLAAGAMGFRGRVPALARSQGSGR